MPCSPSKPNVEPQDKPWSFRIKRWRGNEWVDSLHVCVILRDGVYYECRGPLFFKYSGWSERMGPIVYIGLRFGDYAFDNLSSSDPMRVGLKVSTTFSFNPQKVEQQIAGVLVNLDDEIFCKLVEGEIARWLRPQVAQYSGNELRRGTVFEEIGKQVLIRLSREPDLKRLGVTVGKVQIVEPILPEELERGYVEAAKRTLDVQSLQGWEDSEFARHLALIIANKTGGEQYLNAADVFAALRQISSPSRPQVIDSRAEFRPGETSQTSALGAESSDDSSPTTDAPSGAKTDSKAEETFFK